LNPVGNMLSVNSTIPTMPSYGGTTSYAYDAKNELKTEQSTDAGGYTGSYGYDGAGNPTTFKGVTSAFNSANQNTANVYDQAGNPTTYKGVALTFDAENRLTSYGGSTLTNGYRGDSQRAWKQDGTNTNNRTYFLYSGSQLICELNSSGGVTATNTVGPAGLLSRHNLSGSVFYTFDNHSSVCQRLSGSGSVLSTQTFDAYGSRLSTDGNADPYAGYSGQSGYYTDWETGTATSALELLTFRYYDPSVGRFLTRDPAGYEGGANPYEYVSDGPIGRSDPSGLFEGFWGGLGACAGAILGIAIGTAGSGSCNSKYDTCLKLGDCAVDAASAILGATIVAAADEASGGILAPFSRMFYGCFEGLLSALGHNTVEAGCRALEHPCDNGEDPTCMVESDISDLIGGCLDGAIGNFMEYIPTQVKVNITEAITEAVIAGVGNTFESSSCAHGGEQRM